MLVCDNEDYIKRARFLSTQARDPAPHYQHSNTGYNYRLSNLLAAVGRGQLERLDAKVARRKAIKDFYRNALQELPGIEFMPEAPYGKSNGWLTVILIHPQEFGADREQVRLALEAENIEKPMHMQPVFEITQGARGIAHSDSKRHKARVVGGEVSEYLFETGLCLPSGTQMTDGDLERVVNIIKNCHRRNKS